MNYSITIDDDETKLTGFSSITFEQQGQVILQSSGNFLDDTLVKLNDGAQHMLKIYVDNVLAITAPSVIFFGQKRDFRPTEIAHYIYLIKGQQEF